MGTNAVVSVKKRNKTLIKVIAGMRGSDAGKFAQVLKRAYEASEDVEDLTLYDIYELAIRYIGHKEDLVVLSEHDVYYEGDRVLHRRFQDTFHKAVFNPYHPEGTADHIVVIDLDS